jgi:hypothetical protein
MLRWLLLLSILVPALAQSATIRIDGEFFYLHLDHRYYRMESANAADAWPMVSFFDGAQYGRYFLVGASASNCRRSSTGSPVNDPDPAVRAGNGGTIEHFAVGLGAEPMRMVYDSVDKVWIFHIRSKHRDVICDGAVAPPSQPWGDSVFRARFERDDWF